MIREGRLGKSVDKEVLEYISSLKFDRNILTYDLIEDMAHVVMLAETSIVGAEDASKILRGLMEIYGRSGGVLKPSYEDVHLAVEGELTKRIGAAAGKMHTARSRNDQIACDLRLWLRDEVNQISSSITTLITALLDKASENTETIMPGYTHLQRGQPTTLGHHLLAHCDAFLRDIERLDDAYKRTNLSPLGACALATTSFPIDRNRTVELLGFDGLVENSMDAVSSRDFLLEVHSVLSILMLHVSRLAGELILWSSSEFGFVELSNDLASTSSIMPQKKNPDILEIMRARSSKVQGNLFSCLSISNLPMAYNRDLQELNPIILDSLMMAREALPLLGKVIAGLKVNAENMLEACSNFIVATELADLIVREKNIPFRQAHKLVGAVVAKAVKEGVLPGEIDAKFLDEVSKNTLGKPLRLENKHIEAALSPKKAVEAKVAVGGPSSKEVTRMISARRGVLKENERSLKGRIQRIEKSREQLLSTAKKLAGR
ncbi:MAG: argininosuccinate lyase [Candidatus Hydrothermarchaeales archaeon]